MVDPIMIGILGTASIADSVVEGASKSSLVRITAVAGRDRERTENWARPRRIPHAFDGYQALLDSGAVDAVYIPLPNSLHLEWALRAIEAGLPVLVEKPACTSKDAAIRLRDASIAAGVPVMEAFMYRFHPLWTEVADIISSGKIGEVRTIESRFSWDCDDPDSGPALAGLAGGALFDVGCYCVHMSRMIADCEPSRASAFERRGFRHAGYRELGFGSRNNVDDTMVGLLDFPNGVLAHFETSISCFERHGATICGSKGVVTIERPWLQDCVPCVITLMDDDGRKLVRIPSADTYQLELEAFATMIQACRRDRTLTAGARAAADDIVNNAAALDALFESAAGRNHDGNLSVGKHPVT